MLLENRIAVVTGGARGIGAATASLFRSEGARVEIWDADGEHPAAEDDEGITCRTVDVSDTGSVEAALEELISRAGVPDILVNNAGIISDGFASELSDEDWRRVIEVNLTGAYLCSKAVLPQMRRQEYGRIVFISSAGAFMGSVTGHVAYGASKAGMLALMKVVAKEFAAEGVLANAIAPGSIDTPITESFGPDAKARYAEAATLKRQGTPRELADAVLYLVSQRATYVNGATLHVNGGSLLV